MKNPRHGTTADDAWHAGPALLDAYAGGRAAPVDTWSVEAHLIGCARCRADLAGRVSPADDRLLAQLRGEMLAALPVRSLRSRHGAVRWLRWVLRPAPLLAVVALVAGTAVLDLLAGGGDPNGRLVWLLAPAVPVAAVALVAVGDDDPCREAVLAAPSAVLRLTLWRTLAVLALAVPLASAVGLIQGAGAGGSGWSVAWLLPCLALTSTTLAAGAVAGVERVARVLASLWCAGVLGAPLLASGDDIIAGLRLAAGSSGTPAVFSGMAQVIWASIVVLAAAALLRNRARYDHFTRWNRSPQ